MNRGYVHVPPALIRYGFFQDGSLRAGDLLEKALFTPVLVGTSIRFDGSADGDYLYIVVPQAMVPAGDVLWIFQNALPARFIKQTDDSGAAVYRSPNRMHGTTFYLEAIADG